MTEDKTVIGSGEHEAREGSMCQTIVNVVEQCGPEGDTLWLIFASGQCLRVKADRLGLALIEAAVMREDNPLAVLAVHGSPSPTIQEEWGLFHSPAYADPFTGLTSRAEADRMAAKYGGTVKHRLRSDWVDV